MLLAARDDLTVDGTVRTSPLGALLRDGEDARPSARPGVLNENTSVGLARAACTARSRWPCATAEERSQDNRVELQAIVAEIALADAVGR
jgi:hypothetical protein